MKQGSAHTPPGGIAISGDNNSVNINDPETIRMFIGIIERLQENIERLQKENCRLSNMVIDLMRQRAGNDPGMRFFNPGGDA